MKMMNRKQKVNYKVFCEAVLRFWTKFKPKYGIWQFHASN